MIRQISIENFKSLKRINIDTKNLNLLMGLNGMGKSSLIQVLLVLFQSNKLEERIIDLIGPLAQIGQGRDALYQFAIDEKITFELMFDNNQKFRWSFVYQKDKEKLQSEVGYAKEQMRFFRNQTQKFQYISADRIGPQEIYLASSVDVADKRQLGLHGEYAAYFLNLYGTEYEIKNNLKHQKETSSKLLDQVNVWMNEISPGISLNTRYIPEVNKVILDYQFDYGTQKTNQFRPKNVGFGISYVLSVILVLLTAVEGKIIIIENPESHIHPRGQAELGRLISLAASTKAQLFIETHSDHILNGIRAAVKENLVERQNVNILFFDKVTTEREQYSRVKPIKVDKNGTLSEYPKNFLDEWSLQLSKLV